MKYTCEICNGGTKITYSSERGDICEKCNDFYLEATNTTSEGEKPVEEQNEPLRVSTKPMPSFYSILPAFIRYDNSLTHLQKLLYAEITSLSNKNGYCHAGNAYFSDLYGNSDRTITRAIAMLMKQGYISAQTEKIGEKFLRKIFINQAKKENTAKNGDGQKCLPQTKMSRGGRQKCLHNNTSNNTTSTTIYYKDMKKDKNGFVELPLWLGTTPLSRIVKLYSLRYKELVGFDPNIKTRSNKASKHIRALIVREGEYQVGLMAMLHFNWKGASGNDDMVLKRIAEADFPLLWLYSNANLYKAYILNQMGLENEEQKVKELDKVIKKNFTDE